MLPFPRTVAERFLADSAVSHDDDVVDATISVAVHHRPCFPAISHCHYPIIFLASLPNNEPLPARSNLQPSRTVTR
jgi:hypothetical protein